MKNVEINGFRSEIPGREIYPFNKFIGGTYNTIREWNFEEWRYKDSDGIAIEKVVGNVRPLRRQGWDSPN